MAGLEPGPEDLELATFSYNAVKNPKAENQLDFSLRLFHSL